MPVTKTLAAVALLATHAAAESTTVAPASGKCANPVFNNGGLLGAPELATLQDKPLPFPEATEGNSWPCQAFSSEETCCDATTLTQIGAAFELGNKLINETSYLIANNDYSADLQKTVDEQVDHICGGISGIIPGLSDMCNDAGDVVERYATKLADALEQVAEEELKCAKGLNAYYKGVLCFSCEPDWDQYLIRDASGDVVGFKVNTNTCTNLVGQCEGVNDAVHKVADVAADFFNDLLDALTGGVFSMFDVDVEDLVDYVPDLCGGTMGNAGDCESFFCDSNTVSGFRPPTQRNWGTLKNLENGAMRRLAEATQNVYAEDGYDAYQVGKADEPDSAWVGVLIGVGAAVVVAGVVAGVVVGVKRARGRNKSISQALAPDYDGPGNPTTEGHEEDGKL